MWNVGHSTAEHHLALIPEHTCIPSVCLTWCVPNDLEQHCFFRSTKRKMGGEWEEVNPKRTKPFLVCAVWDPGHACFGLEGRQKLYVYVEMTGFTGVVTPARGSPGICQSPECFALSCLFEFAERGPYCEKLLMQSLITVSNPAEITVFPLDILQ